ncbi:MAG: flagellar hook-associated protein FlgK [Burkholderiaceae bacterium]|nr:flagellar hook-associated protein FlgK [Burkholderiaceae bacterium]
MLGIGQSALSAAQAGLSTTGHNIANAATPGYSRQVVVQGAALPQNFGFGFMGQGTEVTTVKRIYSDYLGIQVQSAQTSKSGLDSYYAQIKQIDNMLADPASGLSPALQDFFSGVQEVASNPASIPARQAALSTAESLASRFQGLAGRLDEIGQGVNSQIQSSVSVINTYAQQIAGLNDAIARAQRATGQPPNDLLDQRDQLILDLNKEIKTTVVKQGDGDYNVFIGNGQPLVVGVKTYTLANMASPTNPEKIEVAYQANNGSLVIVGESGFVGGKLGGLIEFRSKSLEPAQNALGRVAIGLASTFNTQHQAGFDLNGVAGGAFFAVASPEVGSHGANTGSAVVSASISNVNALTTSDYHLQYDGANYTLTRLSDNTATTFATLPQTVDGVDLNLASGAPAAGDSFLIRPTANGASGFGVSLTDPTQIAAAAQAGAVGDNRNALKLGALQTANTLGNGTTSYQGAYSQFVSQIGNKTRELEVTSSAAGKLLSEATLSLQNESGVNLDEEATNLLRYQQAYQAAAKVMQIASEMFDMLLSLGR